MNFGKTFLAALLAFVVGSVATTLLWVMFWVALAGALGSAVPTVQKNSILKIDLAEDIVDAPSTDPFGAIDLMTLEVKKELTLLKALRAIEAAAADDRIEGIYIRTAVTSPVSSIAAIEELRRAIAEFKQSGKFVVAYNEVYGQGSYYLASVADRIYLYPEGGIDWRGLSAKVPFYKGLLDKIGVEFEIFRPTVCTFKSAVEPYFLTKMSDDNRKQMQRFVDSFWGTLSAAVAEARGIEPAELQRIADDLELATADDAVKYRLADKTLYEDQMEEVFDELGVARNGDERHNMITLSAYAGQVRPDVKSFSAPQVGVVYASGAIVDGEGSGKEIYGNSLAATLAEVRRNDDIKAVVLRVNSPGGSALASDVIWREVKLLQAEKPVIVSMGDYAASGGYYISCGADAIVADATTLTGSIGVFGAFPVVEDLMEKKLGITVDGVKTAASADFGQGIMGLGAMRPSTPAERAFLMRSIDRIYETFTGKVASGRNLPIDKVLSISGGRVWSGVDALQNGLVDATGGLKEAIAVAADKAGIADNFGITEVTQEPDSFAALLSSINARMQARFEADALGGLFGTYAKAREALGQQGILMYCPYSVTMQ